MKSNKKNTMTTQNFKKIWEAFPKELKEMLKRPHAAFYAIIKDRFGGKWKVKSAIKDQISTDFPKKMEGVSLDHFTNFSVTIRNEKSTQDKKCKEKGDKANCCTRWKDMSFSPIAGSSKINICVRHGWTKDRLFHNGGYVESIGNGWKTDLKNSSVDISALDNEDFVNFINQWMLGFPEELNAVSFNLDGSVITSK